MPRTGRSQWNNVIGCLIAIISIMLLGEYAWGTPTVSCWTEPETDAHGADLGARFRFEVEMSGSPSATVRSELLVLDSTGEVLDAVPISGGDVFAGRIRDIVRIDSQQGNLRWRVHAPGILIRSIVQDGYETAICYCSPFSAIRVDKPDNMVFSTSPNAPNAPAHVTVGVAQISPESIRLTLNCVDLMHELGVTFPGGPYSGAIQVDGNTIEVSNLYFDELTGSVQLTLSGLPGGTHILRASGRSSYGDVKPFANPQFHRPIGVLEHQRQIHIFSSIIERPSLGATFPLGPVDVTGVVSHGLPIRSLRLHGRTVDVSTQSYHEGDECHGARYELPFSVEIPIADLERDLQSGDDLLSAFDPGVNYSSVIATDSIGNASGARTFFGLGSNIPPPANGIQTKSSEELSTCGPVSAPTGYADRGFAASVSERALDQIVQTRILPLLRVATVSGLNSLLGQELSRLISYNPCDDQNSTSFTCPDQPQNGGGVPPVTRPPVRPINFNVTGDRKRVKAKFFELYLSAYDPLEPSRRFEYEMFNAPPRAELVENEFKWQSCCEGEYGTYDVTFLAYGPRPRGYGSGVDSVKQTVQLKVIDGDPTETKDWTLTFDRIYAEPQDMRMGVQFADDGGAVLLKNYFDTDSLVVESSFKYCPIGCFWLSIHVPVQAYIGNVRVAADLDPQDALCGITVNNLSTYLDRDSSRVHVDVDFPTFGGFLSPFAYIFASPALLFYWGGIEKIADSFLGPFVLDKVENLLREGLGNMCSTGDCYKIVPLTLPVQAWPDPIPLSLHATADYRARVDLSSGEKSSLSLGAHSAFLPTTMPDAIPSWHPTVSEYPSATDLDADLVFSVGDDAINQMFSALASTGVLRSQYSGFSLAGLGVDLPTPIENLLLPFGISEETPIILTLDAAQGLSGPPVPPIIGYVDRSASDDRIDVAVRVQVLTRAIVERGASLVDDRDLCSCVDLNPNCQNSPCVLFEDELKLNLLANLRLVRSQNSGYEIAIHIDDIQQLTRDAGFSAGESVDFSASESDIVHTTADSPLLILLRDQLNANLPPIAIPDVALTLNGYVNPANVTLRATRVDGAGHGIQDYVSLVADIETSPSPPLEPLLLTAPKADEEERHDHMYRAATTRKADSGALDVSNFPNPFNGSTAIHFSLPVDDRVTLKIFNMLGQCVETPLDGFLSAGPHTVTWDGADTPSGIYFYVIDAGPRKSSGKMVLLK